MDQDFPLGKLTSAFSSSIMMNSSRAHKQVKSAFRKLYSSLLEMAQLTPELEEDKDFL